jgi:hypothetical protein
MSRLRAIAMVASGLATLVFLGDASVLANGSNGKRVRYGAEVRVGEARDKRCRFDAELEPLLFRLATVRGKYRVVRITIRNGGDKRLVLSLAGDRVEMELPGGARPAILDLGAHDPALWDSLSPELRGAVAYPRGVEPGEEESVFVFIPVADPVSTPRALRYTIASLPAGPVIMRDMTPVPLS